MKLGIMQPYFFPHIGHLDLINRTDRWVVFDTAQYIRHGWVNRNRILHPTTGWQYIAVPLEKHHRETPIADIRINMSTDWRARIQGQCQHYRKKAPHFEAVSALVADCLSVNTDSIVRLNVRALESVCRYLSIRFDCSVFSGMNLALGSVDGPGDWALRIAQALGASEYLNPPGGAGLFDASRFAQSGIRLAIQDPVEFRYACGGYEFVPSLSIVDVLMWNAPEAVKGFLDGLKAKASR